MLNPPTTSPGMATPADTSADAPLPFGGPRRAGNLLATLAAAPIAARRRSAAGPPDVPQAAPAAREAAASSEEEPSEEAEEATADVFGSLKTALVWDCAGRRLCLATRQFAESSRRLEIKGRGMLDTASGQHRVWGHVRRNFYTHVPLLQRLMTAQAQRAAGGWVDEPDLDPSAFLPGGLRCLLFQDWSIAPGLSYDTARSPQLPPSISAQGGGMGSSGGASGGSGGGGARVGLPALLGQRVRYQLAINKTPQVLINGERNDLWFSARALAEFDPKASEVTLGGSVRLKAVKYGVTGSQDLRLSVGMDVTADETGRLCKVPYFHLSDGKLGARLAKRRWQLTYTL